MSRLYVLGYMAQILGKAKKSRDAATFQKYHGQKSILGPAVAAKPRHLGSHRGRRLRNTSSAKTENTLDFPCFLEIFHALAIQEHGWEKGSMVSKGQKGSEN